MNESCAKITFRKVPYLNTKMEFFVKRNSNDNSFINQIYASIVLSVKRGWNHKINLSKTNFSYLFISK